MTITVTPIHRHIGAEIAGLDLRRPIDEATVGELWRAIDRHAVIAFRDQQISDEQREVVDPLIAEHDVFWSRAQIGFTEFPQGEREKYPPSRQRLVRRHPGSGRKCLYLSAHASHIVGWPVPEGRLLLHDLSDFATQPQFVYSHKWRVGDLVIWDNRDTMHRSRPHDEDQPRDLRRATTLDIGSTLDEAA